MIAGVNLPVMFLHLPQMDVHMDGTASPENAPTRPEPAYLEKEFRAFMSILIVAMVGCSAAQRTVNCEYLT